MDETLNHAPCGFLSFTDEGQIIEVNCTLLAFLGFAPGELAGAKVETIMTVASRIFYQTHLFPLIALHGRADEIFINLQAKDKTDVPMLAYAKRQHGRNDCILVPVAERQKYEQEILAAKKAAEDALRGNQDLLNAQRQLEAHAQELDRRTARAEQKNRELLQVTDILFHDLREPIRKIGAFSGMLLMEAALDQESRMVLEKIATAGTRASLLLRALQEFVSVENGDDTLEPVSLTALANRAYHSIHEGYQDVPAELLLDELPEIEGYSRQLRLLFEQLFDNAFRFRRADTKVQIRVSGSLVQENSFQAIKGRYRYIDFAQLHVRDNGVGIPQEYWGSVFELLKKMDLENPQPGCGLAICRKVVDNHYGSILVVPQDSPGTAFKILLPVKQGQFGVDHR